MGKIEELLEEVKKTSARISTVEKTVVEMGKARGDATETIKKALGVAGGSPFVAAGFDGSDALSVLKFTNLNPRQKSLGCGQWLRAVYVASGGDPSVAGWSEGNVHKALESMGSKPVTKTPLAEGSGATGGYTVPVQFYANLLREVAEAAFVRQRCTTIPMTSRSLLIPSVDMSTTPTAGTSAFFGGVASSWQPEAASINESEPQFRQVELVARDQVFHTIASNQLLQDNAVALDTVLTTIFTEAMAWAFDYYILQGSGVNQPRGIKEAPCAYVWNRNTNSRFLLADAAGMLSHLLMSSWPNAVWLIHQSVLPELIQMADSTNGRLVWLNPAPGQSNEGGAALKIPGTLLGIPIIFTEKLPQLGTKGDVILCDLSKVLVGDRMQMQIETSPHVKFLTNQMVWRVIARWDSQPWLNSTIKLADGSYEVSPIVVCDT